MKYVDLFFIDSAKVNVENALFFLLKPAFIFVDESNTHTYVNRMQKTYRSKRRRASFQFRKHARCDDYFQESNSNSGLD